MSLGWSWWAVPSVVTLLAAWLGAVVLMRTRADRPVNRRLSLVLVLEGLFIGCSSGFVLLVDNSQAVFVLGVIATATMVALIPQYLSFLSILQIPLVAPFRKPHALPLLVLASVAGAAFVVVFSDRFVAEPYQPGWAPWNYQLLPWGQWASQLHGLAGIFGLIVALMTYFTAPLGSLRRARAKWFAVAFGLRDAYVGVFQPLYPVVRPVEFWGDFVYNPGLGGIYLLYVLLLTYGVLQAQLFDIQLRLKFALRHSTVAAFITVSFFVGAELLEEFIPVDSILLGVLGAGLCVLALRPIKMVAEKLANRVMEDVEDTPAYLAGRKLEVYRAALEGVFEDDVVTEKERRILAGLQENLGISDEDAARLEAEVSGAPLAAAPLPTPRQAQSS
jgi:hypothetical protein